MIAAGLIAAGAVVAASGTARRSLVAAGARPVRQRLARPTAASPTAASSFPVPVPVWLAHRLEAALRSADLDADPAALVPRWVGISTLAVVVGGLVWGAGGGVVAVAIVAGGPLVFLAWRKGRAAQRFGAAVPGLLESVAGSLRAGTALPAALAAASGAPTGSALLDADLAGLAARISHGQPFAEAVEWWAAARPLPGVRLAAAALILGTEAGGARARAVDGVAATLRDRRALGAEVDALSSQARASAVVMMGAPVVFAALGLLSDPAVSDFLLRTPAGLSCLLGGLGLDLAAGLWMMQIARAAA